MFKTILDNNKEREDECVRERQMDNQTDRHRSRWKGTGMIEGRVG